MRQGRLGPALLAAMALHGVLLARLASGSRARTAASPALTEVAPAAVEPLELSLLSLDPPGQPAVAGLLDERVPAVVAPRPTVERPRERSPARPASVVAEAVTGGEDTLLGVPSPFAVSDPGAPGPAVRLSLTPAEAARSIEASRGRSPTSPLRSDGEVAHRVEQSLRDHQVDHDRKLGLGSGGPVAAALREATLGPRAPQEGDAIFVAITSATGRVVELAQEAGNVSWEPVRKQALAALATRVLPGASSRRIRIQVRARYQFPSGSKQRAQLLLPLGTGTATEAPAMGAGSPPGRHAPGPAEEHDHRDWWEGSAVVNRSLAVLGQLAFGVVVDPADLAARTQQRVVSVAVLDETEQ